MLRGLRPFSISEILKFSEAWLLLHVNRFAILFLPFRWLAPLIGKAREQAVENSSDFSEVLEIKKAIDRASQRVVFRSRCFDQALTAAFMLRLRRKSATLFLGVMQEGGKLSAHAWVSAANSIVTGGKGVEGYTQVASYRVAGTIQKSSPS